jgi:hypothetical protein
MAFSKKLNLAATSVGLLREDYEMCDSSAFVDYFIHDDTFLKLLDKRYYYNTRGELKLLDYNEDKHFIGKVLSFRSPSTCSSQEGVCKYCYGELFNINEDLFSAGCYAAIKSTEGLGQRILSSKHSQTTNSNTLNFNEDFNKVFELTSNEISLKENVDSEEESLYILFEEVFREEQDDIDFYYVNAFKLIDEAGSTIYKISEDNSANMYLTDHLLSIYKKAKDKSKPLSLESFDSDSSVLFTIEIKNKELTEPIKVVQKLFNSNDKFGAKTLSELCQVIAENFINIGIKYNFVHLEIVLRSLLRKKSNELEFPDWSRNGDHMDYQILRLNSALFKNPSVLISLSYGDLRRQLLSPELYKKTAPSHVDSLFASQLSKHI